MTVIALFPPVASGSVITGKCPPLPVGWVEVEERKYSAFLDDWVSERFVGEVMHEDDLFIWLRSQAPNGAPAPMRFRKTRHLEIRGPGRD